MTSTTENIRTTPQKPVPTVLLVDDDPGVTGGLARVLKGRANILCSNDGRMALEIAVSHQELAFIVLDVTMPEYDAVEFLQDLHKVGVMPPIVLLSGWRSDVLQDVADLAGFMNFRVIGVFEKPIDGNRLIKLIEEYG